LNVEKRCWNFSSNAFGGEIWSLNLLKWKTLNYKVLQIQHTNKLVKENIIQLTNCVCKMALKCQKIAKKWLQKTHLRLNHLLLKWFLVTHNLLDWYEIFTTQTRLIWKTFPIFYIRNKHCIKKKQAAKVHHNPKMSRFWTSNCSQRNKTWIDMKFYYTNYTSKRNIIQQIFIENKHSMKEIQALEVATFKM